jgi:hypothetical protein
VAVCCVAIWFLTIVAAGIFSMSAAAFVVVMPFALLLFAACIAGLAWIADLLASAGSQCPECNKRWAKICSGREIVGEKKEFGLVTRHAVTNSTGWVSGTAYNAGGGQPTHYGGPIHHSGTTSWQERVPVIRTTYLHHFRCRFCNHRWTILEVVTTEDFDIERQ